MVFRAVRILAILFLQIFDTYLIILISVGSLKKPSGGAKKC